MLYEMVSGKKAFEGKSQVSADGQRFIINERLVSPKPVFAARRRPQLDRRAEEVNISGARYPPLGVSWSA